MSTRLAGNAVGPEGAAAIAEGLEANAALATLDLSFAEIGLQGAVAVAEALRTNVGLTRLALHDSAVGVEGEELLRSAAPARLELKLQNS